MEPDDRLQDNCSRLPDLIDQASDLVTGLPPQVKRSFLKAMGRVFTGVAEWPAAYFEGKAEVRRAKAEAEASEIRSRQRARDIVLIESAHAAAEQFGDPALAVRALQYHAADIVREQNSREAVWRIAAEELRTSPPEQDATNEIDDDWLLAFLREASNKTSEDMRLLFGRILAGELKKPGSFSLRTVLSLSLLAPSQHIANSFCTFCSLALDMRNLGGSVAICDFGQPITELQNTGLIYRDLLSLIEHDLVRANLEGYWRIERAAYERDIPFRYADMTVWLAASQDTTPDQRPSHIEMSGPALTQIGEELKDIVSLTHNPDYTRMLQEWLKPRHLTIYRKAGEAGAKLHGLPL